MPIGPCPSFIFPLILERKPYTTNTFIQEARNHLWKKRGQALTESMTTVLKKTMKGSIVKRKLVARLKTLLTPLGFRYDAEAPGAFVNTTAKDFYVKIYLGIKTRTRYHGMSGFFIGFYEVEKTLMKVGHVPRFNYNTFDEKTIHPTVQHKFKEELELLHAKVTSEEELERFISNIESYITNHGLPFVEKYDSLPKILHEMDALTQNGGFWSGLLAGHVELLFRALIIAKLCNDDSYDNKFESVKNQLFDFNDPEWIDAFERMKPILAAI